MDNQPHTERATESVPAEIKPERAAAASSPAMLALAWLAVGLPLLWGVAQTIRKTFALFS